MRVGRREGRRILIDYMNINQEIKKLEQQLKKFADKKRAQQEKNYLKSPFKFFGVETGQKRELVKDFISNNKSLNKKDVWALVDKMWNSEQHDFRSMAIDLLRGYDKLLDYSDLAKIKKMLDTSVGWDQVDEISAHLVGAILAKDQRVYQDLKKWSREKNFWLRRASLLSQIILFRKEKGDRELFYKLATKMMDESWQNFSSWAKNYDEKMGRFFIRKAIGWVLREMSKNYPQEIFQFLQKNKNKMHSLSFREGGRKLPDKYKKKLGIK